MKQRCNNCGFFEALSVKNFKGNCWVNPCHRKGTTPPCDFYVARQGRLFSEVTAKYALR